MRIKLFRIPLLFIEIVFGFSVVLLNEILLVHSRANIVAWLSINRNIFSVRNFHHQTLFSSAASWIENRIFLEIFCGFAMSYVTSKIVKIFEGISITLLFIRRRIHRQSFFHLPAIWTQQQSSNTKCAVRLYQRLSVHKNCWMGTAAILQFVVRRWTTGKWNLSSQHWTGSQL
jgi:hypothetical protein